MKKQKVTISKRESNYTSSHRKENQNGFQASYKVLDNDFKEIIDCRIYATNATVTACLWVKYENDFKSGSGKATGYGYHRESEAVQLAISNAGFDLNKNIGGVGREAIEEALNLIAKKVSGKRKVHLIRCFA